MSTCPKASWPWVKTLLHSVYDQPDAKFVAAQYDRVLNTLAEKLPQVAEHLQVNRADVHAFTASHTTSVDLTLSTTTCLKVGASESLNSPSALAGGSSETSGQQRPTHMPSSRDCVGCWTPSGQGAQALQFEDERPCEWAEANTRPREVATQLADRLRGPRKNRTNPAATSPSPSKTLTGRQAPTGTVSRRNRNRVLKLQTAYRDSMVKHVPKLHSQLLCFALRRLESPQPGSGEGL